MKVRCMSGQKFVKVCSLDLVNSPSNLSHIIAINLWYNFLIFLIVPLVNGSRLKWVWSFGLSVPFNMDVLIDCSSTWHWSCISPMYIQGRVSLIFSHYKEKKMNLDVFTFLPATIVLQFCFIPGLSWISCCDVFFRTTISFWYLHTYEVVPVFGPYTLEYQFAKLEV